MNKISTSLINMEISGWDDLHMHITVPITVCLRQHKNLKALGLVKPKLSHFYKSHQKQKCHDKKFILNVNLNAS